ncbi:Flp pilus assembly protein, pilin Flp [Grimontia indica]|uniref:Flp pilus assembly protein, pilin Flp n=2 Tax=Grimontia TaxID=246861 RepID=R1IDD0_9GAMM|nr:MULTISPECIES: Flp family type IVb pilin [Grimontia]EOD78771.1 Flp pilus assembly protein, pilin Flp [Grimontia indica]NGN98318.1 Flp family type IVb pilin [Grimontia sedimenti]
MFLSKIVERFARDERGVTSIEYAVIGVAISALVVAVFADNGELNTALTTALSTITTNIGTAGATN